MSKAREVAPSEPRLPPPIVTPGLLRYLLNVPQQEGGEQKVVYTNSGPGEPDNYALLIENQEKIWAQRQGTTAARPKMKIIFSNDFFRECLPDSLHLALMATLIDHFDVYLWPGEDVSLSSCTPVRNTAEFWQKRNTLTLATAQKVKTTLSHQGLSPDDFSILDHSAMHSLVERAEQILKIIETPNPVSSENFYEGFEKDILPTKWSKPASLKDQIERTYTEYQQNISFKEMSLDTASLNRLCRALDPLQIRSLSEVPPVSPAELLRLTEYFPNVTMIVINPASENWYNAYQSEFKAPDFNISFNMLRKSVSLFKPRSIAFQNIIPSPPCRNIAELSTQATQKKIVHEDKETHKVFPLDPSIKHLKLTYCDYETLDLSAFPNLETLEVEGSTIGYLKGEACKKLRSITFHHSKVALDHSLSTQIEDFTLKETRQIPDFRFFTTLKKLEMHAVIDTKPPSSVDLSYCKELESCKFTNTAINTITVSRLPKLKSLELNLMDAYDHKSMMMAFGMPEDMADEIIRKVACHTINLQGNPELLRATIKNAVKISISECPGLRELNLQQNSFLGPMQVGDLKECKNLRVVKTKGPMDKRCFLTLPSYCDYDEMKREGIEEKKAESKGEKESALSSEAIRLNQLNKHSRVSRFSLTGKRQVSSVINEVTAFKATGEFKVTLLSQHPIDKSDYRIEVLDYVHFSPDTKKIIFFKSPVAADFIEMKQPILSYSDMQLSQFKQMAQNDPTCGVGLFEGQLALYSGAQSSYSFFPLTTPEPISPPPFCELYANPPDNVILLWHPLHQQFYCTLKPGTPPTEVKILYRFKKNPSYETKPAAPIDAKADASLRSLPPDLDDMLKAEINKHPKLSFLFDAKLTKEEALEKLKEYYKGFINEPLSRPVTDDFDNIVLCITEKKGVCGQRALSFMLIARMLGIPARYIGNENHAFCEILYGDTWSRVELGGGETLDSTPASARESDLDKIESTPMLAKLTRHMEMEYSDQFKAMAQKTEVKSVDVFFEEKDPRSPLIELNAYEDPLDVKAKIITQLKERKDAYSNYLYIDSPQDFSLYLNAHCLEKGERGKRPSPLAKMIREGGTLIVNWSNFTPTEIAIYKSIIDQPPTLLGPDSTSLDLSRLKVIGLKKTSHAACSAFSSRCKPCVLSLDFPKTSPLEAKERDSDLALDLFHHHNWKKFFLGDIHYSENKIELIDSVFIAAIREYKPFSITLNNPPNDEKFKTLIRQIKDEGRLFYNGEFIPVHPGVIIRTAEKQYATESKFVDLKCEHEVPSIPDNAIYLGLHNVHDCFQRLVIDEEDEKKQEKKAEGKKQAHSAPGYLDEKFETFYLTESLPAPDWHRILNHIEHKKRHIHFILAPGVEIPGVKKNDKPPTQIALSNVVILNDPDYFCYGMVENAMAVGTRLQVIDVTPEMGFHDLVAETTTVQRDAKTVDFIFRKKSLLEALERGDDIILNGELSPLLYQQLLPLLNRPPHINLNGKKLELKGSLTIVMPPSALKSVRPLNYMTFDQNYIPDFPPEEKGNIERIEQFYKLASKLPHRGFGFPEPPTLTHARIKNTLQALKEDKLHGHNPIKSVFHYDYPKQSEAYAYLNVIGKCFFNPGDAKVPRLAKLQRLIKKYSITNSNFHEYIWRLLNCLNGRDLSAFLGDHFDFTIMPWQLKILWRDVIIPLSKIRVAAPPSKSHVTKREKQLKTLIQYENRPIIFLKGAPGVGKTYTVNQLKKSGVAFESYSEADIIAWLEAKPDKPCILILDEFNLKPEGHWNFLKGLLRDNKTIFYKNKFYPLTKYHKVIATGNPEDMANREYHSLFQQAGATLHFKMPEDEDLLEHILKPIQDNADLNKKYLAAFHLIRKENPTYTYSTRELENLAVRYKTISKGAARPDEKLYDACVAEFAGTIPDMVKRKRFTERLAKELRFNPPEIKDDDLKASDLIPLGDIFLPPSKRYILEGIDQALMMRQEHALAPPPAKEEKGSPLEAKKSYYKQGVLMIGLPGLGKSTIYKKALEQKGFTKDAKDTQKRYYEISAGSKGAHETLKKAFREGSVVILDELNLDESLEGLLNDLLTGTSPEGAPQKPGFMVFASQNPSYEAGRKAQSDAILNRLNVMYMDPFSAKELTALAAKRLPQEYAEDFAKGFLRAQEAQPKDITMRTFYTSFNLIPAPPVVPAMPPGLGIFAAAAGPVPIPAPAPPPPGKYSP